MSRLVVIGASQGGIEALRGLISSLTPPFRAPILVAVHIGNSQSILPSLLEDFDSLPASFGCHGEPVLKGHIYVAPPDRHMLVMDGMVELSRGPRENWARPAIDPLFRSAALAHGAETIGIILSGRLNDGTAGLFEIKRRDGVAIVQTPGEAEAPDMPKNALENVAVDYCLPVADIGRLLTRLAVEPVERRVLSYGWRAMEREPAITQPSAQTCPECGGAMREQRVGGLTRFVCHIGHQMTAEVLAASQLEDLENNLSAVLRTLNERIGLCRGIADKYLATGNNSAAETWTCAADEAARRENTLKELVKLPWHHPENQDEAEAGQAPSEPATSEPAP
jgi:two-component system chemotaxis response regulator CheB